VVELRIGPVGVEAKITVRTNSGFYAFETEPKQLESDLYYQTEQTFDIVNGNHQGICKTKIQIFLYRLL
jgi:hypothetical protein